MKRQRKVQQSRSIRRAIRDYGFAQKGTVMSTASMVILVGLLLFSAQPTSAQDMKVFGIPLGQPFTIAECEPAIYGYKGDTTSVCFDRLSESAKRKDKKKQVSEPVVNDLVKVRFPITEGPGLIAGDGFLARILDGKLEGIGFNTLGVSNADSVLKKLKEKYGSPTTLVSRKVQNRLGASFDAIEASWAFPDLYVTFDSAVYWLDSGLVNIDTKKGKEWRDNEMKNLLKDKRPL